MYTQSKTELTEALMFRVVPLCQLSAEYAQEETGLNLHRTSPIHVPEDSNDEWIIGAYLEGEESPAALVIISLDENMLRVYRAGMMREKLHGAEA